ncbi:MAG: PAS domain S-box protein [Acidobacteriota bacterium]
MHPGEGEDLYRDLFEQSEDLIALFDEEGRVLAVNPAGAAALGYGDPREVVGRPMGDFLHPKYREEWRPVVERILKEGKGDSQVCVRTPSGETRIFAARSTVKSGGPGIRVIRTSARDITAWKRMERALKEGVKSYRSLFDAVSDALYVQDRQGRFLDVNRGAVAMYGYSREEFLGRTPDFLSAPGKNDPERLRRDLEAAFAGETRVFEWWGRRKNGEVFPKEVVLNRAVYFGQEVVVASAREITRERRSAAEAARAARRYEALLEEAGDAVFVLEGDRFVSANPAACRFFECSEGDLVGAHPFDFSPPSQPDGRDSREKALEKIRAALEGKPQIFFWRHCTKGGRPLDAEVHLRRLEENGTVRLQAVVRDVGERARREELLEQSRGRLKSIFDRLRHVYFSVEMPSRRVLELSDGFEGLFGLPREAIRPDGRWWEERVHPEDRPAWREAHDRLLRGEALEETYRIVRPDGSVRHVHDRTVPVRDGKGRVVRVEGVLEDVTEVARIKELERRARETAFLERLTQGLAHEVRNPLFAIQVNLQLLGRHAETDETAAQALKHVKEQIGRLNDVMKDVLELGRRPSPAEEGLFPLAEALRQAREALFRWDPRGARRVLWTGEGEEVRLRGVPGLLGRALEHLVRNGLEAAPEPSEVAVTWAAGPAGCEIRVADGGPGVPPELQAILFEPFVTGKPGRRGLGLALCRHYASLFGGSLSLERREGGGAVFLLRIPLPERE